jgi:hypothetical protein
MRARSLATGIGFILLTWQSAGAQIPGEHTCPNTTNLGQLVSTTKTVSGTVGGVNSPPSFLFYVTQYMQMATGLPAHPSFFFTVQDDITSRQLSFLDASNRELSIDPGYYCLNVNTSSGGIVNFTIPLQPNAILPAPTVTKSAATAPLSLFDLGNLSFNGYYQTRYLYYQGTRQNPPSIPIDSSHQYVIRDWVGNANPTQWYVFELKEPRHVDLLVSNLYTPISVTIENQSSIVATTTSTGAPGNTLGALQFSGNLPAGMYWLHIDYTSPVSPGTPFQAQLQFQ